MPADLVDDDNPALARVARETTPAAALAAARHKVGAYGAASQTLTGRCRASGGRCICTPLANFSAGPKHTIQGSQR